MTALIIIDMQNDFMPWGSLPVEGADQIIKPIFSLIPQFETVIATLDWHPTDHISFALNHGKSPGEEIEEKGVKQMLWPEHCVQESLGAELVAPLSQAKIQKKIYKGQDASIDSYSAFFDNAKKHQTELDRYLKKNQIKTLYFTGVALDVCVKFSVLDALELGYEVYLIKEAAKGLSEERERAALDEIIQKGAKLITSDKIK